MHGPASIQMYEISILYYPRQVLTILSSCVNTNTECPLEYIFLKDELSKAHRLFTGLVDTEQRTPSRKVSKNK